MSDNPQPIQVPIVFTAETRQAESSLASVQKLVADNLQTLQRMGERGGIGAIAVGQDRIKAASFAVAELGNELLAATHEAERFRAELEGVDEGSDDFARLQREITSTEARIASLRVEIARMPRDVRESVNDTVGFLGDIDSSLATFGGAARTGSELAGRVGAGGLVKPLETAGFGFEVGAEIFAVAEAIPRLSANLGTLRERLGQMGAISTSTAGSLALAAAALVAVGVAAYGVAQAQKKSVEDATGPVKAFLEGLEDVDVTGLDASLIQSVEQLGLLRQQQEAYANTLENNIALTEGFVNASEESENRLLRLTDAIGLPQYEEAITAANQATDAYNEQLDIVRANIELLDNSLIGLSLSSQQATNELTRQLEIDQQRQLLLDTGTTEQLAALREAAERDLLVRERNLPGFAQNAIDNLLEAVKQSSVELTTEQAQQFFDALQLESVDEQIAQFRALAALYGIEIPEGVQTSIDAYDEQRGAITKLNEDLGLYDEQAVVAGAHLRELAEQQAANTKVETERGTAIEALTKANQEAIKAEEERQRKLDEIAKAQGNIAELEADRAAQLAERALQEAQAAEEAALRTRIQAAKEQEQVQARINKINDIQQTARDGELDALRKHEQTKARVQAEFELNQRRRLEDLNDDLDDAAADRDVRSFLRLKEQGDKELDRAAEDNELRQKQQGDALNEQLAEIRRNANERIRTEQEAGRQRLTLTQRLEQELANLQERNARNKELRALNAEEQGYQQRLAALRAHLQQVTQELVSSAGRGLASILQVNSLAYAPAVPGPPPGRPAGTGAGANVALAITIQNQNVGRNVTPQDLEMARQETRNLATTVINAVNRVRTNTGRG
jgi:hypothetical protein